MRVYGIWGKAPSQSDFNGLFPRNCEGTEQLLVRYFISFLKQIIIV